MGKRNNNVSDRDVGENEEENGGKCCNASAICNRSTLKCVVAVIVSVNLLVFAVYNLPFFSKGRGHDGRDAIGNTTAQVQASFVLRQPISKISAHGLELKSDIWDEIGIPDAKVRIISLSSAESDWTKVVFGVVPSSENASISSASLSVLRETFLGLVLEQYNLSLKSSDIFGRAYSFQVLAFPGGITVIPEQTHYPLQHVQVLFNFTLPNTIDQVDQNLAQLKQQLDIYLHVRSDENLFVQLTNLEGSTVESPIIVETSIVPVVGSLTVPRLKQLAKEITQNNAGNLGLNHTLFGKVKQIKLSSYLKDPDLSPSSVPSPAPSPSPAHSTSSPTPAPLSNPYLAPSVPDTPDTPHHHATAPSYHHAYAPSNDNPPADCHHHHNVRSSKCKHQHPRHPPASGLNGAPSPTPYIDQHGAVAPPPITVSSPPPPPQSVPPFKSPPCHSHRPYFPLISPSPSHGPSPSGSQLIPSPPVSPSHSPSHANMPRPSSHVARPPSNSGTGVPSPKFSPSSPVTFTNVPPPEDESSRPLHSEPPQGNSPVSHFPLSSSSSFDVGIPVQLITHSTVFVGALLIYLL